jgi:hypothetical protein
VCARAGAPHEDGGGVEKQVFGLQQLRPVRVVGAHGQHADLRGSHARVGRTDDEQCTLAAPSPSAHPQPAGRQQQRECEELNDVKPVLRGGGGREGGLIRGKGQVSRAVLVREAGQRGGKRQRARRQRGQGGCRRGPLQPVLPPTAKAPQARWRTGLQVHGQAALVLVPQLLRARGGRDGAGGAGRRRSCRPRCGLVSTLGPSLIRPTRPPHQAPPASQSPGLHPRSWTPRRAPASRAATSAGCCLARGGARGLCARVA